MYFSSAFSQPCSVAQSLQPKKTPKLDADTTTLLWWDGIGQLMSAAWHDTLELRVNCSTLVSSDQIILFLTVSVSFRCRFFANPKRAFMSLSLRRGFCLASLPESPNQWSVAVMVVLLEVSPHRMIGAQPKWSPLWPRPSSADWSVWLVGQL